MTKCFSALGRYGFHLALICAFLVGFSAVNGAAGASFNVRTYGATGTGLTDDTLSIQKTITAAKVAGSGSVVYFPAGTYLYSSTFTFDSIAAQGAAMASTTLLAADSNNSALMLTGSNPAVTALTIAGKTKPSVRNTNPAATGIHVFNATGFTISNIVIAQVSSAGILVRQSSGSASVYAQIQNCDISSTLADGIHLTESSSYIEVHDNSIHNTGDDFVAVVSYRPSGAPCTDIRIRNNVGNGQASGRGIATVGAQNVDISGNHLSNTAGSGIYLASEINYDTHNVNGVKISSNLLENCPKVAVAGHAGITLIGRVNPVAGENPLEIKNVAIDNNQLTGSKGNGLYIGAYSNSITVTANTISDTQNSAIAIGPAVANIAIGSGTPGVAQNTINSCGEYGVKVDPVGCSGGLLISGVLFRSVNTKGLNYIDVINIAHYGTFASTIIIDNQLEQPVDQTVERFVEALTPVTEVARNTANITLSSMYSFANSPAQPTNIRVKVKAN